MTMYASRVGKGKKRLLLFTKVRIPWTQSPRAVDPHSFLADPDPVVFLNADPDPAAV